jgi:cytochrome b
MDKIKVWDPFVRMAHWVLGVLVLGSFLTAEKDSLLTTHVALGLGVLSIVVSRIGWGFVGPGPARFASFVKRPGEVLSYARSMLRGRPAIHLSHNPLGGMMVVTVLLVLLGLATSGSLVYASGAFRGPLSGLMSKGTTHDIKEVHEALSTLLLVLVGVHVAGVLASSVAEGQNLVLGMITGRKRSPADIVTAHAPLTPVPRLGASVAFGVALAVVVALLLGLPGRARAAATPTAVATTLLQEWQEAARREQPGFTGFVAEEGRKLYTKTFTATPETPSCQSCHTPDPRREGLTPAGKVVDPLAPVANKARFTDRKETEKWFKRNCKQVIGRECTAAEKGHFVTWLLGI